MTDDEREELVAEVERLRRLVGGGIQRFTIDPPVALDAARWYGIGVKDGRATVVPLEPPA